MIHHLRKSMQRVLSLSQMLSSDLAGSLAGSSEEQATAAEEAALGEGAQPGQAAGRGGAGEQGPGNVGPPEYSHAAMQAQDYGVGEYNHYTGQVKLEDDGRRGGQERHADSGAAGQAGAGGKRALEGAPLGVELSRQSTDESLGRHMEGAREGEDGGTEGEEQEGRGQGNKKQRLVWTAELHSRFMNAVNHLGVKSERATPAPSAARQAGPQAAGPPQCSGAGGTSQCPPGWPATA